MESVSGSPNAHMIVTPTGEVSIVRGGIDVKLAAEIAAARREVVVKRISDSDERIAAANRELQTHLRNGRHLTILTPIQPRTREQVVLAAGALAAKLQWVRMEMSKLKCHRNILIRDMEEEEQAVSRNGSLVREISRASHATTAEAADEHAGELTPTQADLAPTASNTSLPPARSPSVITSRDDHSHRSASPTTDTDTEAPDGAPRKRKGKTVRRSLQRTLREAAPAVIGHRRGKSAAAADDADAAVDEGLERGAGSFTVHGKKASVITFGSEWQNISAEDRLKRKAAAGDDAEGSRRGSDALSRRGSSTAVKEELAEVPEGLAISPALLQKLNDVKAAAAAEEAAAAKE